MLNAWHQALMHKKVDITRTQVLAHKFLVKSPELINPEQFISLMDQHPAIREELLEVIEWCLEQTALPYSQLQGTPSTWLLSLHKRYSRSDIMTAIGYSDSTKRPAFREGCLPNLESKIELMFVTLDKSEGFSERVQYHDYAISPKLFHWQSQNAARATNKTGRRYLDSVAGPNANGWRFYLFVRENKDSAYATLGEALLIKAEGEHPISITWELKNAMPVELFRHFSILRIS
jgi:hypothetical protein